MIAATCAAPGRLRRLAAAVLCLFVLAAGALLVSRSGDPSTISAHRLQPPSRSHPLGTDHLGRDVAARLVHGGRLTLGFAAAALGGCLVLGTAAGAVAARHRAVGGILLRAVDVVVALPTVIVGLALAAALDPGSATMIAAVLLSGWAPFARVTHGLARRIESQDYVHAARALGASGPRIVLRHVLPNAARPLVAHACLRYVNIMLMIAGLSFLGLGAQPPTPEWGAMLAQAQPYAERAPLLVVAPGGAIVAVALIVIALGRRLERRWD